MLSYYSFVFCYRSLITSRSHIKVKVIGQSEKIYILPFCAAHTVKQAGGLHSTEMRSCFVSTVLFTDLITIIGNSMMVKISLLKLCTTRAKEMKMVRTNHCHCCIRLLGKGGDIARAVSTKHSFNQGCKTGTGTSINRTSPNLDPR